MKRINLKEYMYSFFVFFIFILLFGMALKKKIRPYAVMTLYYAVQHMHT